MVVAITGANGFLGSHLVRASLSAGYQTLALVREGANLKLLPQDTTLRIRKVDYSTPQRLWHSLQHIKNESGTIDHLIHNAGLTSSSDRALNFEVNTTLTKNLVTAVRQTGLLDEDGHWIQVSSYAAHGPTGSSGPVSSYGESKLAAEDHVRTSGYDFLIVRPTAIYGPGDRAFLPLFKIAKWGLYPVLTPHDQRVTMIHGQDLAMAIVRSMTQTFEDRILHLTDGQVYQHQDLMEALAHCTGKKLRKLSLPRGLAGGWLKISERLHSIIGTTAPMTYEKYREISGDWDLIHEHGLFHPQIDRIFDLKNGFEETYLYYKSLNLL